MIHVEREDVREYKRYMVKTVCLRASQTFYYIADSTIKNSNYKRNLYNGLFYAKNYLGYSRAYLQ
jgi:hypothetical protein